MLQAASESAQSLQQAQQTLDTTRTRLSANQRLSRVLIADTDRWLTDALTRTERIRRYMAMAKSKPIAGRWPMGVVKQRDDADAALLTAVTQIESSIAQLAQVREHVESNPALAEVILADVTLAAARALTANERMIRLLTEAGLGRE